MGEVTYQEPWLNFDTGGRDLYEVLGVARTASAKMIDVARRVQISKPHPDHAATADEEEAKLINGVHEVLSDPDQRRAYDEWLGLADRAGLGDRASSPFEVEPVAEQEGFGPRPPRWPSQAPPPPPMAYPGRSSSTSAKSQSLIWRLMNPGRGPGVSHYLRGSARYFWWGWLAIVGVLFFAVALTDAAEGSFLQVAAAVTICGTLLGAIVARPLLASRAAKTHAAHDTQA